MRQPEPDLHPLRIAMFTYSTKPRGGVVHSLALAEHLQGLGHSVRLFALGKHEGQTFFRPTPVPFTLIPTVAGQAAEPIAERIQRYIRTYYQFLTRHGPGPFDIYHAQDCISANALWRLREDGLIPAFVRTIHHLDDFISPALIECQNNSIYRPNHRLVVSRYWQRRLAAEFALDSIVINNGVDINRFQPPSATQRAAARARLGLQDRFVLLNIGGIEPRKNSIRLLQAFARMRRELVAKGRQQSVLLLAGGETLFDYSAYRAEFFELLDHSELRPGRDLLLPGVVSAEELVQLYQAADVLAFPSVKEGWGLVALEAMASGLPVLASDLPVFHEYLRSEENALLVDPHAEAAIAAGLLRLAQDRSLRRRLAQAGPATARRFSWRVTAQAHVDYYRTVLAGAASARVAATSPELLPEVKV